MAYDNTNKGALFKNDKKQGDNHPDYKGSINFAGQECWLSAWVNTSKGDGTKYLSLSVKPKEERQASRPPAQSQPHNDLDDEIPF